MNKELEHFERYVGGCLVQRKQQHVECCKPQGLPPDEEEQRLVALAHNHGYCMVCYEPLIFERED